MTRIKQLREEFGMTQEDLAKRLHVDKVSVCNWERGFRTPRMKSMIEMSRIFNCSVDYILGLSDMPRDTA